MPPSIGSIIISVAIILSALCVSLQHCGIIFVSIDGSLCAMHCKDNWNSSMIGLKRFCLKDYGN